MQRNVPLKDFTTFKVGGPADYFFRITKISELEEAVNFAEENNLPILVLGGGSNTLISDKGFSGVVIFINILGISYEEVQSGIFRVTAGAGEDWDNFVLETVKMKLYGLENLSLIPGTVGASPIQNIGAYGVEVSELIESVQVFDIKEKKQKTFLKNECDFSYRNSVFKKPEGKNFIVISVTFTLKKEAPLKTEYKDIEEYFSKNKITPSLESLRDAVVFIRKNKMPDLKIFGTAGSFFKNPIISREHFESLREKFPEIPSFDLPENRVKVPIAWVLDNVLHLKGHREGNVGLFEKQALVLVNYGGATASEINSFAEKISNLVKKETNIVLEREVVEIN